MDAHQVQTMVEGLKSGTLAQSDVFRQIYLAKQGMQAQTQEELDQMDDEQEEEVQSQADEVSRIEEGEELDRSEGTSREGVGQEGGGESEADGESKGEKARESEDGEGEDHQEQIGNDSVSCPEEEAEGGLSVEVPPEPQWETDRSRPPSSNSTASSAADVYVRGILWRARTCAVAQGIRDEREAHALDGCTFRPERAAARASDEMLEQRHEYANKEGGDVGKVLYDKGQRFIRKREKTIESIKAAAEERLTQECSFKPKIMGISPSACSGSMALAQKPRYLKHKAGSSRAEEQQHMQSKDARCTFKPKVNGIRPDMAAAKQYMRAGITERLYEGGLPRREAADSVSVRAGSGCGSGGCSDSPRTRRSMDFGSFLSAIQSAPASASPQVKKARSRKRPVSAPIGPKQQRPPGQRSTFNGGFTAPVTPIRAQHQTFSDFLQRQNLTEARRQQHIEHLAASNTPPFKPQISPRGRAIGHTKGSFEASFMERQRMAAMRRQNQGRRGEEEKERRLMEGCTFQPQLVADSGEVRPRGLWELSAGDMAQRDIRQSRARAKAELEAARAMPFQPQLHTANSPLAPQRDTGRLMLTSELDTLLFRIAHKSQKKQNKCVVAHRQALETEMAGCTFQPCIKPLPEFIKAQLEGVRLLKQSREESQLSITNASTSALDRRPAWV